MDPANAHYGSFDVIELFDLSQYDPFDLFMTIEKVRSAPCRGRTPICIPALADW